MKIDLIELFSGAGGFSKGLEEAGFEIVNHYYSEVDKHAIANFKYNYPNAKYLGSVKNVRHIIRSVVRSDRKFYFTFGSPCQDFSVAGKRAGMDGTKSSLIKYAIFLIRWLKPDIFIWENVKGAFSTNGGADYWAIIQAFTNLNGYRLEGQLLNTAWFLPQNRERIYIIGHFGGGSGQKVFPIQENDRLHNEKNGGGGKPRVINCLDGNYAKGWLDHGQRTHLVTGTISGGGNSGGLHSQMTLIRYRSDEDFKVAGGGNSNLEERGQTECLCYILDAKFKSREARKYMKQSPTITAKSNELIVHNLQPRSGDPKSGGVGHLTRNDNVVYCLDTGNTNAIEFKMNEQPNIRRLTETECEKLQGFPPNWTKFGIYEKHVWINKKLKTFKIVEGVHEIPKTQRYKLMGNAVTVTVVKAIAERLKLTL